LVVPVGEAPRRQRSLRLCKESDDERREEPSPVAFVPLIRSDSWESPGASPGSRRAKEDESAELGGRRDAWRQKALAAIARYAEPPPAIGDPGFVELFDWLGEADVVLLGEADRAEAVLLVGADLCSTRGPCAGTAGRPGAGRRRPYSRWAGCAAPIRECRRPK
jgi:hypothetical protein